ncbi:Type IV secretory pathway, component VirB8 (plasmid) [Phaeobacter piscinae]|uniref:Type IV secretory pathway, component VirB8 n=1 Tax=Phaeobacter piscinae TaxID=1580596 RepID=A0ABM6PJZ7_9RHOB|nr:MULTISPECIES: type IV secretion system protein [Phaeobacter]ATG38090.1 Type IV secretory pathway, component VirB8 [Phaeobacter piscinae]AUQ88611.1 Type IV secretory pathway, component VirB8 [Phaeobacter piscinae]AUQ92600.1 Type IV secretory pathway, component VirB8 [Phaeobacter inhibens]AUR26416.1 Type IV secretory pathway, component VirB8 [Phaeobacter piscinae]
MSKDTDVFEADLILGPRRRERIAYGVAAAGVAIGLAGFFGAVSILPLKTVETHVVVVDKTSGQMDRVAAVQDLTLDESDAIIQANLVAYVDQRETYDLADSQERINSVLGRSEGDAARTLRDLWDARNEDYPITVYGREAVIDVEIRSVNQLDDGVAQVRFTKTLRRPRDNRTVTRGYVATVGFEFRPETKQTLQEVWGNPLGFVVTSYRVDAETLEKS